MLGAGIISGTVIAAIAVRAVFLIRGTVKSVQPWIVSAGLLLLAGGLVLILLQSRRIESFRDVRNWPTVEGVVISSGVVGERAFRPDIVYEYSVGGSVYSDSTDLQMPAFGGRQNKYDAAKILAAMYPAGKKIRVHFDPHDPRESRIKTGVPVEVFLRLSLGVLLFGCGFFGALYLPGVRTVFRQ